MVWPPIPSPADALALAVARTLEETERWPLERLREAQGAQLAELVEHARTNVPFYTDRLGPVRSLDDLARQPILRRIDLQERESEFVAKRLPVGHGPVAEVRTSGSTGRPVRVQTTSPGRLLHAALTLRHHRWHERPGTSKVAALRRAAHKPADLDGPTRWYPVGSSGPMVTLDAGCSTDEQLAWLCSQQADYLLTYPSNLRGLLAVSHDTARTPSTLRHVMTYGEVVTDDLRALCGSVWGVAVVDAYSAQEVGVLALQCPQAPVLHVSSEHVVVEVLDDDGAPCEPGRVGRVVVTDLQNFATPLVRYEVGDFAVAGEACACGRTLPVLTSVAGRTRDLFVRANGERFCPRLQTESFAFDVGLRQIQLVQDGLDHATVRVVTSRPLDPSARERIRASAAGTLGAGLTVTVTAVDAIALEPSGKFSETRCLLEPTP